MVVKKNDTIMKPVAGPIARVTCQLHSPPSKLISLDTGRQRSGRVYMTSNTVMLNEDLAYNKQSEHECNCIHGENMVVIHYLGQLLDGLTPYGCVYPRLHHCLEI